MNQPSQNLYHGKEGPVLGTELITIGNEPQKEYSQPIAPASQIYSENTSSDNPPPVANSEIPPQVFLFKIPVLFILQWLNILTSPILIKYNHILLNSILLYHHLNLKLLQKLYCVLFVRII